METRIKYLTNTGNGAGESGLTVGKEYVVLGFTTGDAQHPRAIIIDDNGALYHTQTNVGNLGSNCAWELTSVTSVGQVSIFP